ncbi:UbiA family prenyltransferase [Adhaeribacter radiodurans]|uniref:UbiA family prenyltransferase n=1 Tax=Adhaeribacter radiodurans TaxID=2745197 RepID=A0A7L7L7V6_9BACT|nr:UbiA family prenyltransferase [Adhaeribacter radiodurans]QMU28906.1 UbiA family prenyltransferase [Adhaeribacter radiodurans]
MADAFKLMRIPFSVFLMPVYWFALSVLPTFNSIKAGWVFVILHLLVYPASNGYNSYFDKDEGSIGGLKHPPKVTQKLFWLVLLFDFLAVTCSFLFVSLEFTSGIFIYLLVSKAYSYDKIRLKKYPVISTLVVIFFQGFFTFIIVQLGSAATPNQIMQPSNLIFAFVSTLFLCGSYPLTQVYQHHEDASRGDRTLSLYLGIKGTFIFSAVSLLVGASLLIWNYLTTNHVSNIYIFLICTGPVLFIFSSWFWQVNKDTTAANFENTMRMNKVSSISLSLAFILILLFTKLSLSL